jgi:glycosyltransferase involved in cell wall biosynthesis
MDSVLTPRVTILMPVYNAEKYLRQAIDSILNQTYKDFIFLIINDGSSDNSENIILSYSDKRIRYENNETNIGVLKTLNKGLGLTKTEFIVRMDADDIAVSERLEWQVEFMDNNPDIGIAGGMYELFGLESGIPRISFSDEDIKASLLFSNPICHPSVILRTEILKGLNVLFGVPFDFDDEYGHKVNEMEDGALWHKIKAVVRFANMNKVLLKYRKEGQNITAQKSNVILLRAKQYFSHYLSELNIKPADEILLMHISPGFYKKPSLPENIKKFREHLNSILLSNAERKIYPQQALEKIVSERWDNLFYYLPALGTRYVFQYWKCNKKIQFFQLRYFALFTLKKVVFRRHSLVN